MHRILVKNPNTKKYWNKTAISNGFLANFDFPPSDTLWEIIRHIDFGNSILDVGAGSGRITRRIKEIRPNLRISACDFSKPALVWLREKIPLNEVFFADLNNGIDKPDKSYDIIVCSEVLEHLDLPESAVKELVRLARKKVIITVPYKDEAVKSTEHVWSFDLDDLYNLLSPFGMVYLTVASGGSNIVAVCNLK